MITEETTSRVKSSLQATKSFLALEVIEQIEKENAELKTREQALGERVLQLEKDKGKLNDENKKLRCCGNCKHCVFKYDDEDLIFECDITGTESCTHLKNCDNCEFTE